MGYVTGATEVHHRRPVEWAKGWQGQSQRMFDIANLMSVCHRCHVEIHKELGSHDREKIKRSQAERKAQIIQKLYGEEAPGGGDFFKGGRGWANRRTRPVRVCEQFFRIAELRTF